MPLNRPSRPSFSGILIAVPGGGSGAAEEGFGAPNPNRDGFGILKPLSFGADSFCPPKPPKSGLDFSNLPSSTFGPTWGGGGVIFGVGERGAAVLDSSDCFSSFTPLGCWPFLMAAKSSCMVRIEDLKTGGGVSGTGELGTGGLGLAGAGAEIGGGVAGGLETGELVTGDW